MNRFLAASLLAWAALLAHASDVGAQSVKPNILVLNVGYRALHQDYKDGDFRWNVTQHGPVLGLAFAF